MVPPQLKQERTSLSPGAHWPVELQVVQSPQVQASLQVRLEEPEQLPSWQVWDSVCRGWHSPPLTQGLQPPQRQLPLQERSWVPPQRQARCSFSPGEQAEELMQAGYTDVLDFRGGLKDWAAELFPFEGQRAPKS